MSDTIIRDWIEDTVAMLRVPHKRARLMDRAVTEVAALTVDAFRERWDRRERASRRRLRRMGRRMRKRHLQQYSN